MSSAEYGSYSYYISILSITSMISGVFLTPAVFYSCLGKFSDNKRGLSDTAILLNTVINLGICLVLFAFNGVLDIETYIPIIIFIQIFFDSIVSTELLSEKFSYSYKKVVIINLSSSILGALISILLVFVFDLGAMGRILGLLLSSAAISFCLVLKRSDEGKIEPRALSFLLKSALPLIPAVIARACAGFSDKLIIKAFIGVDALGKYSVAHTVGTALFSLITSLSYALTPWIIRKLRRSESGSVISVTRELSAIISWGSAILIALAPEIFSFLAPSSYKDAMYVIAPLAISALPYFLFTVNTAIAGFDEGMSWISAATLIGAAISILANLFLIPRIGYIGGGIAYLISEVAMCFISSLFIRKRRKEIMEAMMPRGEIYLSLGIGLAFLFLYNLAPLRIFLLIIPAIMAIKHGFTCLDLAKEK